MAQRGLLITFFQEHWSTFQESAPVQQRVPTLAREVILLKAQREAYIFTPRVPSHLAKECADCAIQNHIAPKQALYCVPGWNVIERIDDNPRSRGQIPEFRRMRMSSCREPNSLRAKNTHRNRERFHVWCPQHGKGQKPRGVCPNVLKQGMKYALVGGNTVYTLEGDEAELDKLAGEKTIVKGTVKGETVTVESVAPATKAVK